MSRPTLSTALAFLLTLPAAAAAQGVRAGDSLSRAEASALEGLSSGHATEYPLLVMHLGRIAVQKAGT